MSNIKSTQAGNHSFASIPKAEIQRSTFNRSSGHKTTFDAGLLIPVFCDEALPGDTFNLRMSTFVRMATPLFPVMDNMYLDSHFFAVPIRLIWDNWQKFNGEQIDPGDSTSFEIPQMTTSVVQEEGIGTLSDHLGIPVQNAGGPITHSALWHRAYNLIWNEHFRDQNLQDSIVVDRGDAPSDPADYVLKRRGKRHDYFTSCLPFPQKGPSVSLPLGTSAPLVTTGDGIPLFDLGAHTDQRMATVSPSLITNVWLPDAISTQEDAVWADPKLEVDLTAATAATINQIREAFQVQRLYERDARGGSRYTEIVRSHFGVSSPDQRLQRPEYLGGGTQTIHTLPVAQTNENANRALGELGGTTTSSGSNHSFTKSFTEHCIIIGMVSVRADLNYQQGLPRMFSRKTRFDFYWPALAHLGEQQVLQKEIWMTGNSEWDETVFGYQERYAEYRYKPSTISGYMNGSLVGSLDAWHLAQSFSTAPTLSETFIEDNPPIDRIIAVADVAQFLFDSYFDLKCARPMPTYSVPGMIDRF